MTMCDCAFKPQEKGYYVHNDLLRIYPVTQGTPARPELAPLSNGVSSVPKVRHSSIMGLKVGDAVI